MQKLFDFLTTPLFGFLLKLFAGIATAAFGLLGIGATTRDAGGRLTPSGKTALVGILVAAFLALGSVVYDYSVAQKAAAAELQKSRHLLLSVQRGVYPLRDVSGEVTISFAGAIPGLSDYTASLDKSLPKGVTTCEGNPLCYGDDDGAPIYRLPSTSSLFPKPTSEFGIILDSLALNIRLVSMRPGPADKHYTLIGFFRFYLREAKAQQTSVLYYPMSKRIEYYLKNFSIPEQDVIGSGVYSLVEIFPGFIMASTDEHDDPLCNALKIASGPTCYEHILKPLENGMKLEELWLKFKYPKSLRVQRGSSIECVAGNEKDILIAQMPDEIDKIDTLGNYLEVLDDRKHAWPICQALNNPGF
jgi:hypothetical protein